MVLTMKRGDTAPPFKAQLLDGDTPVDLTGATAKLLIRSRVTTIVDAAVTTQPDGWVTYAWQAGDTATVDDYRLEVEVTWPDGTKQTFPSDGYDMLLVVEDLG